MLRERLAWLEETELRQWPPARVAPDERVCSSCVLPCDTNKLDGSFAVLRPLGMPMFSSRLSVQSRAQPPQAQFQPVEVALRLHQRG